MRQSQFLVRLSRRSCTRNWVQTPSWSVRLQSTTTALKEADSNAQQETSKRFWKTVGIEKREDSFAITLDKRPLRTPSGDTLLIPGDKPLVATLVAAEWDRLEILPKIHALPMTSIVGRAIDALKEGATRDVAQKTVIEYLDTDTICFHQDEPPPLLRLQEQHWDPLLDWARSTFDVELRKFDSVLYNKQPLATKEKLNGIISKFDHWQLAALERAIFTTKSFIIALALVKGHLTVEEAALASLVEVNSQIERWGEVEDTHDVDYHDVRQQLGSAASLLSNL